MLITFTSFVIIGTLSKEILDKYKKRRNGKNFKPTTTALDDMLSLERIEKEQRTDINRTEDVTTHKLPKPASTVSKDPYDYSSDSSGQGTRFAMRTGNLYCYYMELYLHRYPFPTFCISHGKQRQLQYRRK